MRDGSTIIDWDVDGGRVVRIRAGGGQLRKISEDELVRRTQALNDAVGGWG